MIPREKRSTMRKLRFLAPRWNYGPEYHELSIYENYMHGKRRDPNSN